MTQTEALKQLREVHAIQGRDGCWDIDDYMLGLYNGLELALSIVESRECRYKQRPKSQPEQEPVKDWIASHNEICALLRQAHDALALTSYPPRRTWVELTDEDRAEILNRKWWNFEDEFDVDGFLRLAEATLKEKNT